MNNDYFFPNGIIKLEKNDVLSRENTPLFHITYLIKNGIFTEEQVHLILNKFTLSGAIAGTRSHDNMVAILTYLTIMLKTKVLSNMTIRLIKSYIKDFKIKPDYTHPRDFLYIAMLQNRWGFWLLSPLWFVVFLVIFLYMAIRKYKVRPKLKERWKKKMFFGKKIGELPIDEHYLRMYRKKNGEEYTIKYFFKTDTEILYWIRTKLPKRYFMMHLTRPFVTPFLMLKYGRNWFKRLMDVYYKQPAHPNRRDNGITK